MDSLTQIVLGAAVGEIVLGKKIGNRALLWGAVGGTIPDLDVLSSIFVSPIESLATHRGFSHSIAFALLGSIAFGWIIHRLYQSKYHKYMAAIGWFLIPTGVLYFLERIFERGVSAILVIVTILFVLAMGRWIYRRYFVQPPHPPDASLRDWQKLMFWAIFTHPLLDCFTTYGTQLFQPLSDMRVAFCTVSVVDPIYTLPFLISVIALSFLKRDRHMRRRLAWAGIIWSSLYLAFTVYNKQRVNHIWETTLQSNDIAYKRYMTSPTILNNVLWYCLAETEGGYVYGQYSFFDKEDKVYFQHISKQEHLVNPNPDDATIHTLRWFSNDYYVFTNPGDHSIQLNDLRFGISLTKSGDQHFIFNFPLKLKSDGYYEMIQSNGGPPPGGEKEMLRQLWSRIKGI